MWGILHAILNLDIMRTDIGFKIKGNPQLFSLLAILYGVSIGIAKILTGISGFLSLENFFLVQIISQLFSGIGVFFEVIFGVLLILWGIGSNYKKNEMLKDKLEIPEEINPE